MHAGCQECDAIGECCVTGTKKVLVASIPIGSIGTSRGIRYHESRWVMGGTVGKRSYEQRHEPCKEIHDV